MKKRLFEILFIASILTIYSCEKQPENGDISHLIGTWNLIEVSNNEGETTAAESVEQSHPAKILTFGRDGQVIAPQGGLCATIAESTASQSTAFTINSPLTVNCPPNANCLPNILRFDRCNQSLEVIFSNDLMILQYPNFYARYRRAN